MVCLGYKGEMIKEYFRNYLWKTCDITISLGRKPMPNFTIAILKRIGM